jgi:hypothetical protein
MMTAAKRWHVRRETTNKQESHLGVVLGVARVQSDGLEVQSTIEIDGGDQVS